MLDSSRTRDALHELGSPVSLGEAAALVRQYGSFPSGYNDAVVTMPQFGRIVNHVRGIGSASASPFLTGTEDILPSNLALDLAERQTGDLSAGTLAWYGHRPFRAATMPWD